MPPINAATHAALATAITAAAVVTAFAMPVPAMANGHDDSNIVISNGHGDMVKGSGHEVAMTRAVGAFTSIRVEGPLDVHAHPGAPGSVVVKADDNIQHFIETSLDGNVLVLKLARNATFQTNHNLAVDVPFSQLAAVSIRGSGDVHLDDLTAPRFEASVSGSGDLRMDRAAVGSLSGDIAGSGDVTLVGRADEAHYAIAGSGDMHADKLVAKRVSVSISGSGDAAVHATESLEARIAGSGDIRYAGNPPQVNRHVAGSGEIEPM